MIMKKYTRVTESEFTEFIKKYPNDLEILPDPWVDGKKCYHDFSSDNRESIIAYEVWCGNLHLEKKAEIAYCVRADLRVDNTEPFDTDIISQFKKASELRQKVRELEAKNMKLKNKLQWYTAYFAI